MKAEAVQVRPPRRHRTVVRITGVVTDAIVLVRPRMGMADMGDEEEEGQGMCLALRHPSTHRVSDQRAVRRLQGERRVGIRGRVGRTPKKMVPPKQRSNPQVVLQHLGRMRLPRLRLLILLLHLNRSPQKLDSTRFRRRFAT